MNHQVSFYETESGKQPVRVYYLDRVGRSGHAQELASILRHIDLLVAFGADLPALGKSARSLVGTKGLLELRAGHHRIAYGQSAGEFVLLHAWRKRGSKASRRDIERAQVAFDDWCARHPGVGDT